MAGSNDLTGAKNAVAVTKSDTTLLATTRALWIGGVGDVALEFESGATVTLTAVPAGTLLPVQVVRVLNTGTSATAIVALY